MLFEIKTSFRQGSLSSSRIRVYKSRNLVGLEFHHVLMDLQFLITCTITKTKGRTFLHMFKVRIQVLWCEKNTASHKKVHILDWKLMAVHDCLHWIHVPMMLSEKECIKAISPASGRMEKPESGIWNPESGTGAGNGNGTRTGTRT